MASEVDFANLLKKFQLPDNMDDRKSYSASNETPPMNLRCPECGVTKESTEDLEVHLKIEHLDWIPFQCPVCLAERASDAAMREHVYTNHKNSVNKFIYIDNQEAKKELQILIDRAIQTEIQRKTAAPQSVKAKVCKRNTEELDSPPSEPYPSIDGEEESPEDVAGETDINALLASITRTANGGSESPLMGGESPKDSETAGEKGETEDTLDNLVDSSFNWNNLAALLGGGSDAIMAVASSSKDKKNTPKPDLGGKKKVAGFCSQCNKSVTSGARQMHIFFHLAKDFKVFRFRCLFEGCDVEHYRKDQMENHQSKVHGHCDHTMMEDRSTELFSRCQELSMKLLGTKNTSTPGPSTATEGKSKGSGRNTPVRPAEDEKGLECRLCQKTMQNRVRGFHILWHMAKDLGIMRYVCKICGFAHDRSQSIVTHGKKEHESDDVLLDKIKDYDEELNEMSDKCFGFKSTIGQEKKRKNEELPEAPGMPQLTRFSPVAKKKKLSNESAEHSDAEVDKSMECSPEEDFDDEQEGIEDEEEV